MGQNATKAKLANGGSVYGASVRLGSPLVAEILATSGFDYLYIDQQHGFTSYDTLIQMLQATARTGATPLVRVAENNPALIGQALDAGAEGVIVPMVNSMADAERAVAACRYAPVGSRSFGPLRAAHVFTDDHEEANREILCLVMIETEEGVRNADAICTVPGVDGVYIGPNDLALSTGLPPTAVLVPGVHADSAHAILAACQQSGIVCGIPGDPAEVAPLGFRLITIGSDYAMVLSGMQAALKFRP